jgi:hypothetical protein
MTPSDGTWTRWSAGTATTCPPGRARWVRLPEPASASETQNTSASMAKRASTRETTARVEEIDEEAWSTTDRAAREWKH